MWKAGHLPLLKPYMVGIQSNNVTAVNEALNELYVEEEEDYERLHDSIDMYDSFDQFGLAQLVEKHEPLEMRRITAYIYKKAGRWKQSVALSKKDNLYKDAMETTSQSGDRDLAEELLSFFVEQKECFASCLYTCYDLIRHDVAMELAWFNGMLDFAFPYVLQFLREYTGKVDELMKDRELAQQVKEKEKDGEGHYCSNEHVCATFATGITCSSHAQYGWRLRSWLWSNSANACLWYAWYGCLLSFTAVVARLGSPRLATIGGLTMP